MANGDLPSFDAATKAKDPRHKWFVRTYGKRCWEVDALNPVILRKRVEAYIRANIDIKFWTRCEIVEQAERESLVEVMGAWKGLLAEWAS